MEASQFFPLGEGLELTQMEQHEDQLVLHVTATSPSALCPLCQQPSARLHSRYRRVVKDLPCVGQHIRLILHVRKFFCDAADCVRKVFAERLPHLVAPWAQMTTRHARDSPINRVSDLWQTRRASGRAPEHHHPPL
jgi:transposase